MSLLRLLSIRKANQIVSVMTQKSAGSALSGVAAAVSFSRLLHEGSMYSAILLALMSIAVTPSPATVMPRNSDPPVRASDCPGSSGERARVALAEGGAAEASVARRLGCSRMHSSASTVLLAQSLARPIRVNGAGWMIANVTLNEPGATGNSFDAVLRRPVKR